MCSICEFCEFCFPVFTKDADLCVPLSQPRSCLRNKSIKRGQTLSSWRSPQPAFLMPPSCSHYPVVTARRHTHRLHAGLCGPRSPSHGVASPTTLLSLTKPCFPELSPLLCPNKNVLSPFLFPKPYVHYLSDQNLSNTIPFGSITTTMNNGLASYQVMIWCKEGLGALNPEFQSQLYVTQEMFRPQRTHNLSQIIKQNTLDQQTPKKG